MSLYEILNEKGCLNVLKELYEVEYVLKTAHSLRSSEIRSKLPPIINIPKSLSILVNSNLIHAEIEEVNSDNHNILKNVKLRDTIISLTLKGKQFFEQFDKLKSTLLAEPKQEKGPRIEYTLTDLEKRILILCFKIQSEIGTIVPLRNLTQEVYPHKDPSNRIGAVSKYVSNLSELNLMEKIKTDKKSYAKVTKTGERVIQEQFMETTL